MGHSGRHPYVLVCAAVSFLGCTAVLGIDGDYYLSGQGGATSATVASVGGGMGKPRGEPCADGAECQSEHCTDGVCCEEICDGACVACSEANGAAQDGACAPIAALTDPAMECATDQTCNGAGECVVCGARPEPPVMACPIECSSCPSDGVCAIDCGVTTCEGLTIACPAGFECEIACTQADACRNADIFCPDTYACSVDCAGDRACEGAQIACSTGVCELDCRAGAQVCNGADLDCGSEACLATCAGRGPKPQVACGQACVCVSCE